METIPYVAFDRIMKFSTTDKQLLKQVVRWERANKAFAKRLLEDFWPNILQIHVQLCIFHLNRYLMQIQEENYNIIDVNALAGFKRRGVRMPSPMTHIKLGDVINVCDPEIIKLLQANYHNVEIMKLAITNPKMKDEFVNVLLNLKSLKMLALQSAHSVFHFQREAFFYKLKKLPVQCLMIISKAYRDYEGILENELFSLLENKTIKCLHLRASNHYIERWLATKSLHNRAQITNLCITNSPVSYHRSESGNESAPLYHAFADYKTLFPRLRFLCMGICLAQFDDNRLDSMLSCYYLQNSFDMQVCLTVRLFHKSPEIQLKRFDWIFSKLRMAQAKIDFSHEKTDEIIDIKSKDGNILSKIIMCFYAEDVSMLWIGKRRALLYPKHKSCIEFDHYSDYSNLSTCLCANNQR